MLYNPNHFVDREHQLAAFEACLGSLEKSSLLLFRGQAGMGKTTILYRMREICRKAAIPCARVDFQSEGLLQPEAVIDRLGDELRGQFFDAITEEKKALDRDFPRSSPQDRALAAISGAVPLIGYNGPGGSVPQQFLPAASQVEGSIGPLADGSQAAIGQNITQTHLTINNPIFASPGMEAELIQKERLRRLNHVMRSQLEVLTGQEKLVLLFDACDNPAEGMVPWLREQILEPLLYGSIPCANRLAVVLVGDEQSEKGAWLKSIMEFGEGVTSYALDNLPPDAVIKYWIEIRGLAQSNLPSVFLRGAPPYLLVQMANFTKGIE